MHAQRTMAATLWGSVASDAPPLRFAAAAGLLALAQDSVLRVWRLASAAAAPALLLATPSGVSALALGARGDDDHKLTLAAASVDQLVGWLLTCEGAEEVAVDESSVSPARRAISSDLRVLPSP